jgi:hypothetical protein
VTHARSARLRTSVRAQADRASCLSLRRNDSCLAQTVSQAPARNLGRSFMPTNSVCGTRYPARQPAVEKETSRKIVFADSHRSSPAALEMVNGLAALTGGQHLRSADPGIWPEGGLAGPAAFRTTAAEAEWTRGFAAGVLHRAPGHRIGILARSASRRRLADAAIEQSGLPYFRWDDPLLDTDTAKF